MPQIILLIPLPLRKHTQNADTLFFDAADLTDLHNALFTAHPGLRKALRDPRRVFWFRNGVEIAANDTQTRLAGGDEIALICAASGGASGTEVYNLTFQRDMFGVPILHGLGKKFRVVVNIRRAVLNEEAGWAEVSLSGPAEEIGRAIADLQTTGVNVSGPLTDLIEPDLETRPPSGVGRGT